MSFHEFFNFTVFFYSFRDFFSHNLKSFHYLFYEQPASVD